MQTEILGIWTKFTVRIRTRNIVKTSPNQILIA